MTDYELLLEAAVGFQEENAPFDEFNRYYESVICHHAMPVAAIEFWNMAHWVCNVYKPSILLPFDDDLR